LGDKEVIEKENGKDYLRIILLDGKVIGGKPSVAMPMRLGSLSGHVAQRRCEPCEKQVDSDDPLGRRPFMAGGSTGASVKSGWALTAADRRPARLTPVRGGKLNDGFHEVDDAVNNSIRVFRSAGCHKRQIR